MRGWPPTIYRSTARYIPIQCDLCHHFHHHRRRPCTHRGQPRPTNPISKSNQNNKWRPAARPRPGHPPSAARSAHEHVRKPRGERFGETSTTHTRARGRSFPPLTRRSRRSGRSGRSGRSSASKCASGWCLMIAGPLSFQHPAAKRLTTHHSDSRQIIGLLISDK